MLHFSIKRICKVGNSVNDANELQIDDCSIFICREDDVMFDEGSFDVGEGFCMLSCMSVSGLNSSLFLGHPLEKISLVVCK